MYKAQIYIIVTGLNQQGGIKHWKRTKPYGLCRQEPVHTRFSEIASIIDNIA